MAEVPLHRSSEQENIPLKRGMNAGVDPPRPSPCGYPTPSSKKRFFQLGKKGFPGVRGRGLGRLDLGIKWDISIHFFPVSSSQELLWILLPEFPKIPIPAKRKKFQYFPGRRKQSRIKRIQPLSAPPEPPNPTDFSPHSRSHPLQFSSGSFRI